MKKITLYVIVILFLVGAKLHAQAPIDLNESRAKKGGLREYKNISGILGAFPEEIKFLLTQLKDSKSSVIMGTTFTEGVLNGRHVVLAQTGIGKVNASVTTLLMIEHFAPKEIIFTGIAGGINPNLSPGDIVIGTRVAHHDFGTITSDSLQRRSTRDPATMIENPIYFKCDTTLVRMATNAGKSIAFENIKVKGNPQRPHIISGTIVTGDVFVASSKVTSELRRKMNADATEMEGAAVAQVSWQQRVPFVVIRSISDNAGETAYADVKTFYQSAAKNSAHLVMGMMNNLK